MFTIWGILIPIVIFTNEHNFCQALSSNSGTPEPGVRRFVVSIGRNMKISGSDSYRHVCGGALRTRKYVLTSAKCFPEDPNPDDYVVYVQSNDLKEAKSHKIKKSVTYDHWFRFHSGADQSKFKNNDIALLELSEVVDLKGYTKPRSTERLLTDFKTVTTAVWGPSGGVDYPRYLLKGNLAVIPRDECIEKIREKSGDPTYTHEENILCTHGDPSVAVLEQSDRGSPVYVINGAGEYEIIGINLEAAPGVEVINKHLNLDDYVKFMKIVTRDYSSKG